LATDAAPDTITNPAKNPVSFFMFLSPLVCFGLLSSFE